MEQEIWKPIKGFENYEVSNKGRIKSLNYRMKGESKTLSLVKMQNGYYYVRMYINNKHFTKRVHRLVAEAFVPNPENRNEVNHKNGVKTDNRAENLEWCTHSENLIHAFKNGHAKVYPGESNHNSKCTNKIVKEIRKKYSKNRNKSLKEIGEEYSMSITNVSDILNYKIWRHI